MNFSFNLPVRIVSGNNCVADNASLLCIGNHALIVTGKHGAKKSGALDDVISVLTANGIGYTVFDEISEIPLSRPASRADVSGRTLALIL